MHPHGSAQDRRLKMDSKEKFLFTFEFHIPYYALRRGQPRKDKRTAYGKPLRSSKLLPLGANQEEQLDYYYQANNSFLIVGVDEWLWSAYCCVDSFYTSEVNHRSYFENLPPTEPCSGGGTWLRWPTWNPRQFFLYVLLRRLRQATREWKALIDAFERRMAVYVRCPSLLRVCSVTTVASKLSRGE